MNQVSATVTSGDATATSAEPGAERERRARMSKVYKTEHGSFWHFESLGRRRSSYLQTACGRRLGRWNLLPARATASMPATALCVGCVRKATS